ncbi:hypothetical protein IE337_05810 [Weissella viridescens]|jgi:hypothetical protein|uniref:hypothetical protein n=1 Tax=Weissella viridescens TaxID=1629 RepID=UPI001747A74E|nr:hypothetical protein [Weissella viridescens]QOD85717.1 hypothetical protein IE337_05810 [Weissella viridescens]WJI90831.1 hypothetical protein PWA48_05800 [Weissella viridescens]
MFKKKKVVFKNELSDEQALAQFEMINRLTINFVEFMNEHGMVVNLPVPTWDTSSVETDKDKIAMVMDATHHVDLYLKETRVEREA